MRYVFLSDKGMNSIRIREISLSSLIIWISSWVGVFFHLAHAQEVNPPADPANIAGSALSYWQMNLNWSDNSDNEAYFEIERAINGSSEPFILLDTVGANITIYKDEYLTPETEYCYRVRAVNQAGNSGYSNVTCEFTPVEPNNALDFGGTNAYVTFGAAPSLGVAEFTIECWFRRDGPGVVANTGTGGIYAIPLVTKGVGEAEIPSNLNMNYFLGTNTDNVLAADFEDNATGANHPVVGKTAILNNVWYHAAVTYNGFNTWKLYLNGALDTVLVLPSNYIPESNSIQHAAIASALTSTGIPAGYFDGVIDEVRIWNYARSEPEIQAEINSQIATPQNGLLARWGINEESGVRVHSSSAAIIDGTILGSNWSRGAGAPFGKQPPDQPAVIFPANGGNEIPLSPPLTVAVSDPDNDALTVTFYGRAVSGSAPGPDFTLIGLPDTQYYTSGKNGGSPEIFKRQTEWIVANKDALNIVYTAHLGDCVDDGDLVEASWQAADTAMGYLEDPLATNLLHGIPFGLTVGNHDQSPNGNPDGTTNYFNQYFGADRFSGRGYYGGHYGSNNDNHYDLFNASGLDFIAIHLEYDPTPDAQVMAWADSLLQVYSTRRAIIISHYIIGTGNPGPLGPQGQVIHAAFKHNPNVFLLLCAHVYGEGQRSDIYNSHTVHTLLADYQHRPNGGNGWLRIMEFSPVKNEIRVKTYSPWLDQWETDSNSQFTLSYDMQSSGAFQVIGIQTNVASGSIASVAWPALSPLTSYEWHVSVNDGHSTISGPIWKFTTANAPSEYLLNTTARGNGSITRSPDLPAYPAGTNVQLTATPASRWKFKKWSGDLSGNANPQVITINGTTTIFAAFENTVNHALSFAGNIDYVAFGAAPGLGAARFTLETWFKRTGAGSPVNTGTGGIVAIPLITKGRSGAEGSILDMNYFLGISAFGNVLTADFEEGSTGSSPGLNHPVFGVTPVLDNVWYHATATYDGNEWRLYLNGVLERSVIVGQPPQANSILHAAIATALNSDGEPRGAGGVIEGFFAGIIDEARIWNYARTGEQIRQAMCRKLSGNENGLLGYWRLDETSGAAVLDFTGNLIDGAIISPAQTVSRVYSGAALGDVSAYDYNASQGFSASLSHPDGDKLSAATTAGSIKGIQVYRADADALRPGTNLPPELASISQERYWGVFVAGGNPQYTVIYDYSGYPGVNPHSENQLRLAYRDDHSVDNWVDVVVFPNTGAHTLTAFNQSGSEYGLAFAVETNSSSVQVSSFTARGGDARVSLKWITESEENNQGFILERALAEGGPFAEIASYTDTPELQSQGNSSQQVEYAYADEALENGTAYYYRLSNVDLNGIRSYYGAIINATPHVTITEFRLYTNYPNPFNPGTTIKFEVPEDTPGEKKIEVAIYNTLGQQVRRLYDGLAEGGVYKIYWDTRDGHSNPVASGIYFVRLRSDQYVKTIKMTLLR